MLGSRSGWGWGLKAEDFARLHDLDSDHAVTCCLCVGSCRQGVPRGLLRGFVKQVTAWLLAFVVPFVYAGLCRSVDSCLHALLLVLSSRQQIGFGMCCYMMWSVGWCVLTGCLCCWTGSCCCADAAVCLICPRRRLPQLEIPAGPSVQSMTHSYPPSPLVRIGSHQSLRFTLFRNNAAL